MTAGVGRSLFQPTRIIRDGHFQKMLMTGRGMVGPRCQWQRSSPVFDDHPGTPLVDLPAVLLLLLPRSLLLSRSLLLRFALRSSTTCRQHTWCRQNSLFSNTCKWGDVSICHGNRKFIQSHISERALLFLHIAETRTRVNCYLICYVIYSILPFDLQADTKRGPVMWL